MSGYRKAILAGLIALVGSLAVAATDNHITLAEWFVSAAAGLGAVGGVYGIRNEPADDAQGGAVEPGSLALGIILGVLAALLVHRLN